MRYRLEPPLQPRDGRVLRVLIIARISTLNQDVLSLRDQEDMHRRWVAEHFEGKFEAMVVATRGSGERLDRQELEDIRAEVATGKYDLVIMEDLGRYMRDLDAIKFCGFCVDHGTRL